MVLEIEGTGFIYCGGSPSGKVEVEVAHLGRALEINIKDWAFSGAGSLFSKLVLKTHI